MTTERIERAVTCFAGGHLCSQAICRVYGEEFGLTPEMAVRIATGFGAGISRSDQVCGAVSGSVMVLGLAFGSSDPADRATKERTYAVVREFIAAFKKVHGSISCTELLGHDLGNPAEAQAAREDGVVPRVCPGLVRTAAELLEECLANRDRIVRHL